MALQSSTAVHKLLEDRCQCETVAYYFITLEIYSRVRHFKSMYSVKRNEVTGNCFEDNVI